MDLVDDIILVDKPKGITSFDVIRRLRKELNIKKMGHAGTLDPLATGLMIIGVNAGTKKLTDYIKLSKEYIAEMWHSIWSHSTSPRNFQCRAISPQLSSGSLGIG